MRSRNRTITIADDDRARVPFAMIGALILVSSVALVVSLELQGSAEVDVDDSLAMERTASAANTALYDATAQATHDAALEPVTEPADSDLGDAISDDGTYTGDEFFERYVKLRIYLEAQDTFAVSGQEFREMETEISIDPVEDVDDVDDAIESVTLTVGGDDIDGTLTEFDYGDERDSELGHGTIEVELDDVEFVVEREGEVVAERTQPLSVTVGTPLFDLHHLTAEYEAQLNHDFAEAQADDEYVGFDQYFASRLYPLAWERGYAQSDGEPIAEVISNRHVETLANDALFQTQRAVFGEDDPHSDRLLTTAYACMLGQDANQVYDTPDGGSSDIATVIDRLDEEEFCDDLGYVYDDFDEAFTDPPDWTELASQNDYLEQTETVGLDETGELVLGKAEIDEVVQKAIDTTYTVDTWVDADIERTVTPDEHPSEGEEWGVQEVSPSEMVGHYAWVEDVERVIVSDETDRERAFYELEAVFVGEYGGSITWTDGSTTSEHPTVRYDIELTVNGEHSPNSELRELGMETDYAWGPYDDEGHMFDYNYQEIPDKAIEETLSNVDDAFDTERQLRDHMMDEGDGIFGEDEVIDLITAGNGEATLHPDPADEDELRGWLVEHLEELEADVSQVSTEFERRELLNDGSPLEALRAADRIDDDDETVYNHIHGDHYVNAPHKAQAAVRLAYMDRVRDRLDTAIDRHEAIKAEFDEEIAAHMNRDLEDLTAFSVAQFDDDPDPRAMPPEYPLLNDLNLVPSGSPAYLTVDSVTNTTVPTIGTDGGFAPMAAMNQNAFAAAYDDGDPPSKAVELAVAGQVLAAGNATDELVADATLASDVDALESALEAELEGVATAAAEDGAAPFDSLSTSTLEGAIATEIENLGSIDEQARALGYSEPVDEETVRDDIAANVANRTTMPDEMAYQYDEETFETHLKTAIRHGLDDALGEDVITDGPLRSETRSVGEAIRAELAAADVDIRSDRLNASADGDSLVIETPEAAERWLETDGDALAPNVVPSGTDVIDEPAWNLLTVNLWHVDVRGQYSRFTTKAQTGTPSEQSMRYVRDDGSVELAIGEITETVGSIEPISFQSRISVPVAVPANSYGVGDRTSGALTCSKSYAEVGPIEDETAFQACAES